MKPQLVPAPFRTVLRAGAAAALTTLLASCGGGGDGGATVTNITASSIVYGRQMTVTVNGTGLSDTGIFMTVEGAPCDNPQRSGAATDVQVQFACTVAGAGTLSPRIRTADGTELARITVSVPTPRFSLAFKQGAWTGLMTIELDPAAAPVTVANFVQYANAGFYRDTIIHRVVQGSVVQGGGYELGPTPKLPTSPAIALESNNGLKNLRGTIAMARTADPDSATSQFYFNVRDNPAFDRVSAEQPGYAVFGRLISGEDVLDRLGSVATQAISIGLMEVPVEDVQLTSVLQVR